MAMGQSQDNLNIDDRSRPAPRLCSHRSIRGQDTNHPSTCVQAQVLIDTPRYRHLPRFRLAIHSILHPPLFPDRKGLLTLTKRHSDCFIPGRAGTGGCCFRTCHVKARPVYPCLAYGLLSVDLRRRSQTPLQPRHTNGRVHCRLGS